jgi:AhpD family alkylhydroperoxidase
MDDGSIRGENSTFLTMAGGMLGTFVSTYHGPMTADNTIPRVVLKQITPDVSKAMGALHREAVTAAQDAGVEAELLELVRIRASQINGCAFCLDMHVKEAKLHGERELRLYHLSAWRESTLFVPRERAALAWTEILTKLPDAGVPDEVYERVRTQLSEEEISDLTFIVMGINAWNRINVGFRTVPGAHDKAFGLDKAGLS